MLLRALIVLQRNSDKAWFAIAVIVLIAGATVVLPIGVGGIRRIPDLQSYVHFASAYKAAMLDGQLFPAWADDNLGFGSVGVRFYPPAAPFVTALLQIATGDWFLAFSIALAVSMAVGCWGIYLFVREWAGPGYGILAAVLYGLAPFHLAEIFRFFLYAEFIAGATVPFCFLYLGRVARRGTWKDTFPLAISFSLLVLSHLPLTVLVAITSMVFAAMVLDWTNWRRRIPQLLCSALMAACATAFYWIRIVLEFDWVAHSDERYTLRESGFGAFLFPNSLAAAEMPEYSHLFRHMDVMVVLCVLLLLPFLAALAIAPRRVLEKENRVAFAVTLAGFFGIFMVSLPSSFLWAAFDLLQRLQFPWRWLAAVSVLASASFALSLRMLRQAGMITKRVAILAALGVVTLFAAYDAREIRNAPFRLSRGELNRLAETFRFEKTSPFWWPAWAREEAFLSPERVTAGDRAAAISRWDGNRRSFTVDQGPAERVRVGTFYYPYWRARIDGRPAEIAQDEHGAVIIEIGQERSEVEMAFEEPEAYAALLWVSVAAWIVLIGSLGVFASRSARRQSETVKDSVDI